MPVEGEHFFKCPYCGAEISIAVDYTAGAVQSFSYDCEVCCRPMAIRLRVGGEGVISFEAQEE